MSRCRFTAAQLHGTPAARRMTAKDRAALAIETPEEIQARIDRVGEKELQRECSNLLRLRGIWFDHSSHKVRENAGKPDLLFSLNGKPIAVELKAKNGKLSDVQKITLDKMAENGWKIFVVFELEQFRQILNGGGVIEPERTKWRKT